MKKIAAVMVLLLLALMALACTHSNVQRFNVEAGRMAFVQETEPAVLRGVSRQVVLPEGLEVVADWGDMGVYVAQVIDEDAHAALYGVYRDDKLLLPCTYRKIEAVEGFYLAHYRNLDEQKLEIFDRDGTLLIGSEDTSATVSVVSSEYFALYTTQNAQLFDRRGNAYFGEGIMQPSMTVAACGDYILTVDATTGVYCIWDGSNVLRHRFYDADTRYVVAYVGERFLVAALMPGTEKKYTYIERSDGTDTYMRQKAWWYYPQTDYLEPIDLDYVLLSVRNVNSPGVSAQEAASIRLAAGYSAAVVAELDRDKVHVSDRYYVLDADATTVVRYPVGINPTAIYYRADLGFVGSSSLSGAAALYDLAGNLLWQNKDHAYATMRWQWGRLVASYHENGATLYGAFDSEGNVALRFAYQYMSAFYGDRCVVRDGGVYSVLDGTEKVVTSIAISCPEHWLDYGIYTFAADGKEGVKGFDGAVVVPAEWDAFESIGFSREGKTYLVGRKGNTRTVLELA